THPLCVAGEAMDLVRKNNIQVIIARGGVSLAFHKCTDLPIVDMVVTVQELGMLIVEAKARLKKEHPTIAIIGYPNMFCDLSDIEILFGIRLKTYYVSSLDEMAPSTRRAAADGTDLAIGGIYVKAACEELGLPYLNSPAGTASVRYALQIASHVSYTIDLQQRTNSESNTLLNFSFNGIMKLDREGKIVTMNPSAESLLDVSSAEVLGQHISVLIPAIDPDQLNDTVFQAADELFSTFWHSDDAIAVSIAPVLVDGKVDAAILSCYDIEKMSNFEKEARFDLYNGNADRTKYTYKWLTAMTDENTPFIRSMDNYAQYDECVLLSCKNSVERLYAANFIYTNSLRRDFPFADVSAASYPREAQLDALFGSNDSPGEIASANGGTIFIDEIEALTPACQQRLFRLIKDKKFISRGGNCYLDIRFIIGTAANLKILCENGEFRWDLYYAVNAVALNIPPLEGCPNEIVKWATFYVNKYCESYGRYMLLTKAARRIIGTQPWKGGHAELRSFCKKIASDVTKRVLDEATANRLLKQIAFEKTDAPTMPTSPDHTLEEERIRRLIEKYSGNRNLIAEEMRISKTTLWRRMKKYGLV
ncbi:MAG: sigma 54-interacting transcriptional regulator, partial [Oscillospiraceae bacterium]